MDDENKIKDLIAEYALGSLDADEAAEVEALLAKSESAREELASYQQVSNLLGMAVPEIEPSASFEDRLFANIETSVDPVPDPATASLAQSPTFWERLSSLFSPPQQQLAWAGLTAVLLIGIASLFMQNRSISNQLAQFDGALPTIVLSSVDDTDVTGLMVLSSDGTFGTAIIDKMPELTEDEAYQLWLQKDGVIEAGPTFDLNPKGYGARWVRSDFPLGTYDAFIITSEPAAGSDSPTGPKVLEWSSSGG